MTKLTHKARPAGSIEEATARLIDAVGGPSAASALPGCAVSRAALDKYLGNDSENATRIGARLAAYFEAECGVPHVSAWMAAQSGHVVVALPAVPPLALPKLVAKLGKETGELFAEIGRALEDKRVSAAERARLLKELSDVVEVAAAARLQLERDGGGGP